MKKFLVLFLCLGLLLSVSGSAFALSLLVSEGRYSYGGYGRTTFDNMTAAIDAATGNNVDVVYNFEDLTTMLAYDAIWLDARESWTTLSTLEIANITSYISTGRKAVLVGENSGWTTWNNQLMGIVGGTFSGTYSGYTSTIISNELTDGVSQVYLPAGGIVVSGGTALFDRNFATLWGDNVLTVLDLNVHTDSMWSYVDNAEFAINVANWVADSNINPVPEPATMLLLGSGLAGLAGLRRRFKGRK